MPLWTIFTKWPEPSGPVVHEPTLVRRQRLEQRHAVLEGGLLAAHHQTVAVLIAPHAAGRAGVHVVQALTLDELGVLHRVAPVGVATVDDDVVLVRERRELMDRL